MAENIEFLAQQLIDAGDPMARIILDTTRTLREAGHVRARLVSEEDQDDTAVYQPQVVIEDKSGIGVNNRSKILDFSPPPFHVDHLRGLNNRTNNCLKRNSWVLTPDIKALLRFPDDLYKLRQFGEDSEERVKTAFRGLSKSERDLIDLVYSSKVARSIAGKGGDAFADASEANLDDVVGKPLPEEWYNLFSRLDPVEHVSLAGSMKWLRKIRSGSITVDALRRGYVKGHNEHPHFFQLQVEQLDFLKTALT